MATGKGTKGNRTDKKSTEELQDPPRKNDGREPRAAKKRPESQSGTAEDLFWGGSDDQGEVQ